MEKQTQRILAYLDAHGSITQREASDELGVARLASRICDIRKAGVEIVGVTETGYNRFGEVTRYTRYRRL